MADIKSPKERSRNMAAIHSKNTSPELFLRRLLFGAGFRYRVCPGNIPGHPDLWLKKYNTAIFVHGCFWHRHLGCCYAYIPGTHTEFWEKKFSQNTARDEKVRNLLLSQGIRCLVVWECTIKTARKKTGDPAALLSGVRNFLVSDAEYGEL